MPLCLGGRFENQEKKGESRGEVTVTVEGGGGVRLKRGRIDLGGGETIVNLSGKKIGT